MGFRELEEAGVADLLEKAVTVIAERGLAKGLRVDPRDNSVDPVAALAIAAGAPVAAVHGSSSLIDLGVPAVKEVALLLAVESLEAILDSDLEQWSDLPEVTAIEVQKLFQKTATRLRIAIT